MNTTATATANTAVLKPKTQRKPKAKLPPALAHELDVLRAARMGIDISYMTPDERCKYPSKFCCNKRARKSTGKLHRFCEDHRSRANVNQKRWTDIRRRHEQTQDMIETSLALCAGDDWMDVSMPLLAPALYEPLSLLALSITAPQKTFDWEAPEQPPSPTQVHAMGEDEIPISEEDIEMLTTIVAQSEQSVGAATVEDAWLMAMLSAIEPSGVTPELFEDFAISAL